MLIELFAVELPESLNCKANISCWYAKAMRCSAVKASLLASLDVELDELELADDVLVDDVELDESDVPLMSGGGPSGGGAPLGPSGGPALSR